MLKRGSVMDASSQSKKAAPARVKVGVRLRPYMSQEENKLQNCCVRGLDDQSLEIINWRNQLETMKYQFDAFYGDDSTQQEVYARSVEPVLSHLLDGQNASVFAYGPTGAGKTHTMLGSPEHPGIIPRAVKDLFQMTRSENSSSDHWTFKVTMSYLEIYQEKVLDLLEPKHQDLPIREDQDKNIFIPNLTQKIISSFSDFENYFIPASQNRTVASTKLNDRSSRSHAVLLIKVQKREGFSPFRQFTGKLYLIDLAGSEDNRRTGNQGIRLKESGAINSSLFVLSKVVDALNQGLPRIPYRDSKLTRLLQDSLGGSAHSVMITNIAPGQKYYFDTLTALNFAAKSKQIVNKPFTQESNHMPSFVPIKRQREGKEPSTTAPQPNKKLKSESGEESPKPTESSLSTFLKTEGLDSSVVERLLNLEQMLMKKGLKGIPLPRTPKGERLELKRKVEESQIVIQELMEKQRELEAKALAADSGLDQSPNPGDKCQTPEHDAFQCKVKPLQRSAASCTIQRKQAIVQPLQVQNQNTPVSPLGEIAIFKKERLKKKVPCDGSENEANWGMNINADVVEKTRSNLLHILNTGDLKELKSLHKIGDKKAKLIFGWRKINGPLSKIEDLQEIEGMSAKMVASFIKVNLLSNL
ncbi:kinesin-like protein KIF22 [Ambystoma mexicanum]|uniref:kinesin-like protein KIF22 n=1 Tax=Ambystoma mexicanum TaxID=8296 RepID=UPI0037E8FBEE